MNNIRKSPAAVLLALIMAAVFCVGVAGAEVGIETEITGLSEDFGAGGYYLDGKFMKFGHVDDFAYLTGTQPGTEIFLPLRSKDFEWKNDRNMLPMTARNMDKLNIEFWTDEIRGGNVFDRIAFTEQDGVMGLLLDFVDEWPFTEEQEFEIDASFSAGGEEYEFQVRGTMRNRGRSVYATTATVQLGVGRMATGFADVSGVKFDLGAGVSMTADIQYAQTVYGAAKERIMEHDQPVLAKYPQIVRVLHLDTVNLRSNVRIDTGDLGVLHVYNAQLVYLGTTSGPVRYEMEYYLSTTKL